MWGSWFFRNQAPCPRTASHEQLCGLSPSGSQLSRVAPKKPDKTTEQTLAALKSSERLSELVLQSGSLGTWSLDIATQTAVRSRRHDEIFGYAEPEPEWTYNKFLSHVVPQDRELVDSAYRQALEEGRDWEFEARISRVDGQERWIWVKGQHFKDDAGTPVQIIGLVGDVTDRKRTELILRQSEKLAAVGRLTSTIAHEMNNPLEAVTNLIYLASHSEDLAEVKAYLNTAEGEIRRVSAITAQTLRFHHESQKAMETTWGDLLYTSLAIFKGRLISHHIEVQQRHRSEEAFLCFPGEIRQVLNNLIGNAIDAMQRGGRLIFRSRLATDWRENKRGIRLTIADTGGGMSPTTLGKIYDPFFSTKGAAGTGLGLWVSQDIVQRHHGTMLVRTSQDLRHHGTVFTLFLPLALQPEEQRLH